MWPKKISEASQSNQPSKCLKCAVCTVSRNCQNWFLFRWNLIATCKCVPKRNTTHHQRHHHFVVMARFVCVRNNGLTHLMCSKCSPAQIYYHYRWSIKWIKWRNTNILTGMVTYRWKISRKSFNISLACVIKFVWSPFDDAPSTRIEKTRKKNDERTHRNACCSTADLLNWLINQTN